MSLYTVLYISKQEFPYRPEKLPGPEFRHEAFRNQGLQNHTVRCTSDFKLKLKLNKLYLRSCLTPHSILYRFAALLRIILFPKALTFSLHNCFAFEIFLPHHDSKKIEVVSILCRARLILRELKHTWRLGSLSTSCCFFRPP